LVRRFNTGTEWDSPDLAQPEAMRRAVETLRQAHQLGPIAFEFSPFRDIERRLRILRELPVDLPDDSPAFVARACEIETRFWRKPHSDSGLCHNDPFASNFIVTANSAQLIDWEFAGMGDVFYDLACVSVYYPAENHHHVLQWYFGEVRPNGLEKLKAIRWVMHLWNWTWAVLQVHNAGAQQEHVELEKNLLNAVRSGMRD
jgi:thiamine kinase-like enzyme